MTNPKPRKSYKITHEGKTLEYCRTKAYAIQQVVPKWREILRTKEIKIENSNQSNP